MNNKIELYVDDNHPQINDNVDYFHLSHCQTVDSASCMEISLNECLDYALERNAILPVVIEKLRYGGILRVAGVDLISVMESYNSGVIDTPQLQQLLYSGRMSADTCEGMIAKLKAAHLTIVNETLTDNQYFITAARELKE